MGPAAARVALVAGALVVLATLAQRAGFGPRDLTVVAGTGLLVATGAAAVGFASTGSDRRTALLGALLGIVPTVVLAASLAAADG